MLKNLERQLLRLGNQYLLNPLFQQGFEALLGSPGGAGGAAGGIGGLLGSLIGGVAKGAFSGSDAMIMPGGPGKSFSAGTSFTAESGGGSAGGIGGLIGQGIGAIVSALFHEGGVVGAPSVPHRPAPAEVFLDAPRYHAGGVAGRLPGLAANEVPAILQRGEMVLTEPQQRQAATPRGAPTTIINQIHTPSSGSFRESRGQISAELGRATQRALARST